MIYSGLIIYALFFISVTWTGWFDAFFSGAALHDGAKGIDFYQVPRGAWAFWHGGSLTGDPLANGAQYAEQYSANGNVYHPVFTLIIGSLLMQFSPEASPIVWLWLKFFVSLLIIAYFFWSFRKHSWVSFATFVVLANMSIYLELAAWQFHFVLNMLLFLLLIFLVKRKSEIWNGLFYGLSLLVKPIGLLFAPLLLLKGHWKTLAPGVGVFIFCTVAFLFYSIGNYYTDNLAANLSSSGTMGPNQIITFAALIHYVTNWPTIIYQAMQDGILLLVVFLTTLRRIPIAKGIFLAIAYYLCFYEQVFEYQWSSLAYAIAVCIVTCPEFQTRRAGFCILLTCLPDCFVLLNLLHIDVTNQGYLGLIPGPIAWEFMVISKLLPLFILLLVVFIDDIKPVSIQVLDFWKALLQANDEIGLFGENGQEADDTFIPLYEENGVSGTPLSSRDTDALAIDSEARKR